MKKLLLTLSFATIVFFTGSTSAQALTQAEKDVLSAQIMQQIAAIQAQINQIQSQQSGQNYTTNTNTNTNTQSTLPNIPTSTWCYTFNNNLGFAQSGSVEVGYLHTAMQREGIAYGTDGTNVYTQQTADGVAKFQARYGILTTGFTGPLTRAKLNQIYSCTSTSQFPGNGFTVVYPGAGQTLRLGDTPRITWTTAALSADDTVSILVYMPSQPYLNIKTLTENVPATQGYYDWQIAEDSLPSTSYPVNLRIKIVSKAKNIITNSSDFAINNSLANQGLTNISLIAPNGGQTLYVGDTYHINWSTVGLSSNDNITITIFAPSNPYSNIKTIVESVAATQGYYDWVISKENLPSTSYPATVKIKLEVRNKNISTTSASSFAVNSFSNFGLTNINLLYPNGGQTLYVGNSYRISWSTVGFSSTDNLAISVYSPSQPYSNVRTVTESVSATQGYYDWTISKENLPSISFPAVFRIKIDSVEKNISTVSATDFIVNSETNPGVASISLVYPNGGQTMTVGNVARITWTTLGLYSADTIKIHVYNPANPFVNVRTIAEGVTAGQGYYDWAITKETLPSGIPGSSENVRVKIEVTDKNISTFSASDFSVSVPSENNGF